MTVKESTEKKKRITFTHTQNKLARYEQPDIKTEMNKERLQKVRDCWNEKYSCWQNYQPEKKVYRVTLD